MTALVACVTSQVHVAKGKIMHQDILNLLSLLCIRDVIRRIVAPKKIPCPNSQDCECDRISHPKIGYLEWQKEFYCVYF